MVEELCTRYGDLYMIWFDGGADDPRGDGPDVEPIVNKYQPNCLFTKPTPEGSIESPVITNDLSNQKVTAFAEDAQGHIWIGTSRGALFLCAK